MEIITDIDEILDIISLSNDRGLMLETLKNPNSLSILGKIDNGGYSLLIKDSKKLYLLLFIDKMELQVFVGINEHLDLIDEVNIL